MGTRGHVEDTEGEAPDRGVRIPGRRRLRLLLIGIVDAGSASVATFVMGMYAAVVLDEVALGVYAIFVTSWLFGQTVVTQTVYVPGEVASLPHPRRARSSITTDLAGLGAWFSALVALAATGLALLVVAGQTDRSVVMSLAVGSALVVVVSPWQDHLRRTFHLVGRSWGAAVMSGVQLVTMAVAILVLHLSPVGRAWVPFLGLAIANTVSSTVGFVVHRIVRDETVAVDVRLATLWRTGRWLAVQGSLKPATGFVVGAIVILLSDAAQMGYAESARIIAQPILVVATGMITVSNPRLMEAAHERDARRGRTLTRMFTAFLVPTGIAFGLLVSVPWSFSPLVDLVPKAYTVTGVIAVTVLSNVILGLCQPMNSQLVGGRYERRLTSIEIAGTVVRIGIAFSAVAVGAMAVPLGLVGLGVVRLLLFPRALRDLFASPRLDVEAQAVSR